MTRTLQDSSTVTQDLSVSGVVKLNATVPVANASTVGTVKPGTGLSVAGDGTLSVSVSGIGDLFIESFGAVGNGSTDDTAAFDDFNAWAIAQPSGSLITLNFEAGKTYMVGNPWWPCNIRNLVVNGNGSTIKNNASVNVNKSLLNPSFGLNSVAGFYSGVDRYLISTTSPGDTSITCATHAEAGNLTAGDMIMVASYDLQFSGQPPSYLNFEYKTVLSANASTGVVQLDGPILYEHLSNYPYKTTYGNGDGRAHIERIEQGSLFNINHTYNDITFLRNAVGSSGATSESIYTTGYNMAFNNCSGSFLPTINKNLHLYRCTDTSPSGLEVDKLITRAVFTECVFPTQVDSATSVNLLQLDGCVFGNGYFLCPKELVLNDCDVANNARIKDNFQHIQRLTITGGVNDSYPAVNSTQTQTNSLTIDGATFLWDGATNTLTVPIASGATFIAGCAPGQIVHSTFNYLGGVYPTGVYGIVQSITGDNSSNAFIVIEFLSALAGTETLTIYQEPWYVNLQGKKNYLKFPRTKLQQDNLLVTSSYAKNRIITDGNLTKITLEVLRPYTGSTGGNILMTFATGPTNPFVAKTLDLKTVGTRISTQLGNVGWTGANGESAGFTLSSGTPDYIDFFDISTSAMASTSDSQLPIVSYSFELESPSEVYSGDL